MYPLLEVRLVRPLILEKDSIIMSKDETLLYCSNCQKKVNWHVKPVNHSRHLIIAICTLGMWLPAWLGLSLLKLKYCDHCESTLSGD